MAVVEFDPSKHYELDDAQVDALVNAIESYSTDDTNASESVIRASLFLTSDKPVEREQEFIDELVEIKDTSTLKAEKKMFEDISNDFTDSTSDEDAPAVLQTKFRFDRIVSLYAQTIDMLEEQNKRKKTQTSNKKRNLQSILDRRNDAFNDDKKDAVVEKSCSIFDSNWFRFAAFSIVAVILLLAVVFLVQWLRTKHENDEKNVKEKQASNNTNELL